MDAKPQQFGVRSLLGFGSIEIQTPQKGGVVKPPQPAREGKRTLAINLDPQANMPVVPSGGQFEFKITISHVFESAKKHPISQSNVPAQACGDNFDNLTMCRQISA